MDNALLFWITSFANSQDQPFDEAKALNGSAPTTLWDQEFADQHAAANANGTVANDSPLTSQHMSK